MTKVARVEVEGIERKLEQHEDQVDAVHSQRRQVRVPWVRVGVKVGVRVGVR